MSPFLDDRGRLFGKVNLVDVLVLVALGALLAFALLRFSDGGAADTTIRTTFVVEKVRETSFLQFKEGDEVRDDTGTMLGTIERAGRQPSLVEVPTDDGRLTAQPSPVFWDLEIVVRGSGNASSSLVRIGNVPMRVGKIFVLTGPTFEVRAQIRDVEVVG